MKKVILITGSSRGLGRTTAITLASKGYRVYATMRDPSSCPPFEKSQGSILIKKLDVTDREEIFDVVEEIIANEGRIDVAINNAGAGLLAPIEIATDSEIATLFDVNVYGVVRVMQAVLPHMRKQRDGRIINISSIAGIVSSSFFGFYAATKHAVEAISASAAATVFPWNIKVTVIEPGAVSTDFAKSLVIGERVSQKGHPYHDFCLKYINKFNDVIEQGQPAEEVADLIAKVIEMENPDFRYQTSPRLKKLASSFIADTTGNQWLREQQEKVASWMPPEA